jgi:hypothetical protein
VTAATTKPTDALAAFDKAFTEATRVASDLRAAYQSSSDADQALAAAQRDDSEAARVAFVVGREHEPDGTLADAIEQRAAVRQRLDELQGEDQRRQATLTQAVEALVESGGKDRLTSAIEQLIDAGQDRLELAVDELVAARRQLGHALSLISWLDDRIKPGLRDVAVFSRVEALPGRNGDAYSWAAVEDALRGMAVTARAALKSFADRKPPVVQRVSDSEMTQWNLAAGGSFSDSVADIRARYLERGPRRNEAALDAQEAEADQTRDQRTWR